MASEWTQRSEAAVEMVLPLHVGGKGSLVVARQMYHRDVLREHWMRRAVGNLILKEVLRLVAGVKKTEGGVVCCLVFFGYLVPPPPFP